MIFFLLYFIAFLILINKWSFFDNEFISKRFLTFVFIIKIGIGFCLIWVYNDYYPNKTKISKEIDEYNKVGKEISDNLNVSFIDITTISRSDSEDYSLVVSDGLHPSKKMYQLWVNVIFNEVKKFY